MLRVDVFNPQMDSFQKLTAFYNKTVEMKGKTKIGQKEEASKEKESALKNKF